MDFGWLCSFREIVLFRIIGSIFIVLLPFCECVCVCDFSSSHYCVFISNGSLLFFFLSLSNNGPNIWPNKWSVYSFFLLALDLIIGRCSCCWYFFFLFFIARCKSHSHPFVHSIISNTVDSILTCVRFFVFCFVFQPQQCLLTNVFIKWTFSFFFFALRMWTIYMK